MASKDGRFHPALIMGVLAISIGVLLLLDHAGLFHVGNLWRFWPVVLIVLGLNGMYQSESKCRNGSIIASGMMAFWGLMLLAQNFGFLTWGQIWPLALIVFGVIMIWQTVRAKDQGFGFGIGGAHPQTVFSSVEKTITDQDFRESGASAVFGSVELDFIQANMAGDSAVVEVSAVFGSIEIRVPISWNVVIEAGAVFGSCENRTRAPLPAAGQTKTLYVRGGVVFGSVEVKN